MAEHRQMTHSGPNPYVCDWPDCTDAFPGMKDLTEHKRNHLIEANALSGAGSGGRQKKAKQPVAPKPFMCDFGKCSQYSMDFLFFTQNFQFYPKFRVNKK